MRPRTALSLAGVGLLAMACGGASVGAMPGGSPVAPGPDAPVTAAPDVTPTPLPDVIGTPGHPQEPKPRVVEPRPGMADVSPIPWDQAVFDPDDATVEVRYWSGVEPCYVLDHVAVDETPDAVTITLFPGHEPAGEPVACIEIAERLAVRVDLERPVGDRTVRDGDA